MGSRARHNPQLSHVKGQQHLCSLPALRVLFQQNPKEKPMGTSLLAGLWQKAVYWLSSPVSPVSLLAFVRSLQSSGVLTSTTAHTAPPACAWRGLSQAQGDDREAAGITGCCAVN